MSPRRSNYAHYYSRFRDSPSRLANSHDISRFRKLWFFHCLPYSMCHSSVIKKLVYWPEAFSNFSNGFRQGGVLSPVLYTLYVDSAIGTGTLCWHSALSIIGRSWQIIPKDSPIILFYNGGCPPFCKFRENLENIKGLISRHLNMGAWPQLRISVSPRILFYCQSFEKIWKRFFFHCQPYILVNLRQAASETKSLGWPKQMHQEGKQIRVFYYVCI